MDVELLSRAHDREAFDCGSEALNSFLRRTARQHLARGISRTVVLTEGAAGEPKPILGFFTMNICQVRSERLSPEIARRLPSDVSGIKLGRLAVAKDRQRQGLGKVLLIAAMKKAIEVFESAGGIGLFVDAKDETAAGYYRRFGFLPLPDHPMELFLPIGTIQQALGRA